MSINEVVGGIGSWSVQLTDDLPDEITKKIDYWGHIVVVNGDVDPERYGDQLLETANYVGPLLGRNLEEENKAIDGYGMEVWLGDGQDDKGEQWEEPQTFTNDNYTDVITALLPEAVTPGTIHNQTGLYSGTHLYESRRKSIKYVTELYDTEYRVNGDGTLDAGKPDELYDPEPSCAIVRRISEGGIDLDLKALPGKAKLAADMKDFTTRVLLLAEGQEATTVTATADIAPEKNPYKDIHGNPVVRTRIVNESGTSEGNSQARATLQLNRFINPREAISLTTLTHDIKGDIRLGGYVWVEDQDALMYDLDNEVKFKGETLHPVKLRVTELNYPIEEGQTVAYRHWDGTWINLTPYVVWENGETTVTVGGYARSLTGGGGISEPIGRPVVPNTTVPDVPEFIEDQFLTSSYTSPESGETKAQVELRWTQPLNTDLSIITDGGRYEVRYRTAAAGIYRFTNNELAAYKHDELVGTYDSPIAYEVSAWSYAIVPWGTESMVLTDLTAGIPYDFQIRAVDNGTPPNMSEWSSSLTVQTRPDTKPPETPNPPVVAASQVAVQVMHTLGAAANSGEYNLDADLHHLEVHRNYEPTFEPDPASIEEGGTMLGLIPVTVAALRSQTPAVATFQITDTHEVFIKVVAVDTHGNRSLPSTAASVTAELIDDAYISNLTVSKVTAGYIQAVWGHFGTIESGSPGTGIMRFAYYGLEAFDTAGTLILDFNTSDGSLYLNGTFQAGKTSSRVVMGDFGFPTIRFYSSPTSKFAYINSYDYTDTNIGLGLNSAVSDDLKTRAITYLWPEEIQLRIAAAGPESGGTNSVTDQNQIGGVVAAGKNTAYMVVRNSNGAGAIDGGAIFLGRYNTGSTIGHYGTYQTWQEFKNDGGIEFFVRNFSKGSIGTDGAAFVAYFGTSGAAGVDFRAPIKSAGGDTVFFYWSGGNLNIGTGASFVKTFVIDHPDNDDRYLVHATVEGPVAATEYFDTAVIVNHEAVVELPAYFQSLNHDAGINVQLTPVMEDDEDTPGIEEEIEEGSYDVPRMNMPLTPSWSRICKVAASPVKNGKFKIYSDGPNGTKVHWVVKAIRKDVEQFDVEPLKTSGARRGDGPYTYFVEN